ncbi:hypothetical protein DC31_03915 [Microbacterium sp. CH12i]|uniref:DUF4097 family beta strand repeat-containing protein n=1 Tax=Microbacterium sp. CH12i TaxID=1479651 RepID=UPI00046158E3|nr:DUF4097 family beta strand repeat-containing protein [Microbacterium sp. CH12i]KDA05142.1 hypothetical protein DC31_03915 [Microbacterium sp. CH12i]
MTTESQNPQGGHDVPLTPPPAEYAPAAAPTASDAASDAPRASRGSGARAGAIALAVFGGLVLLGTGGTAAVAAVHDMSAQSEGQRDGVEMQSVNVDGIDAITLDVAASDVTARFGDVEEATLEVTGSRNGSWTLERDGDELSVRSPDNNSWFGIGWFGDGWFSADEQVVLTLPQSLNDAGLDADLSLGAGSLDVEGAFNDLHITVGAGSLSIDGAAQTIEARISAGRADLNLSDVDEADLGISAGKLEGELTGSTPHDITIDVSAGSLDLTVPNEAYNVTQDVSAGSLDNRLNTSSSAQSTISASVSAGSVVLRPGN